MKGETGIIKKFINSIYNLDEFPKYVKNGVGKAILYAFILSLFLGGIRGTVRFANLNNYMNEVVSYLNQDEYSFEIKDNKLHLETTPIAVENNKILFYVDDSISIDKVSELKNITANEEINFLILEDGLILRLGDYYNTVGDTQIYYSNMDIAEKVTNTDVINVIESSRIMLCVFLIICEILEGFLMYIMAAFLIAVLTVVPSRLLGVNYSLGKLFSLAIYAYTFPSVLVLILNIVFPYIVFDMACMIGTMVYTYLAIRNIRNKINEKVV